MKLSIVAALLGTASGALGGGMVAGQAGAMGRGSPMMGQAGGFSGDAMVGLRQAGATGRRGMEMAQAGTMGRGGVQAGGFSGKPTRGGRGGAHKPHFEDLKATFELACPDALAICGLTELPDRSPDNKDAAIAAMECLQEIALDSVTEMCEPFLEKFQDKGARVEEIKEAFELACPDALAACGLTELPDRSPEDTQAASAFKECLQGLPLDSVSDTCQPVLEKFQSKVTHKEELKAEFELACPDALAACNLAELPDRSTTDRESAFAGKECLQGLPLDSVSETCQPMLEKVQGHKEHGGPGKGPGGRPGLRPAGPIAGFVDAFDTECTDALASCGLREMPEPSRENMENMIAAITCLQQVPVDQVSEGCQPLLERLQSRRPGQSATSSPSPTTQPAAALQKSFPATSSGVSAGLNVRNRLAGRFGR